MDYRYYSPIANHLAVECEFVEHKRKVLQTEKATLQSTDEVFYQSKL